MSRCAGPDNTFKPGIGCKASHGVIHHPGHARAADGYFEEASNGTLAPGKAADFVILDGNPMDMAERPDDILRIAVLQTVKDGKTVFTCTTPCAPRRAVELILAGMKK